jgi:hypothetical protein
MLETSTGSGLTPGKTVFVDATLKGIAMACGIADSRPDGGTEPMGSVAVVAGGHSGGYRGSLRCNRKHPDDVAQSHLSMQCWTATPA